MNFSENNIYDLSKLSLAPYNDVLFKDPLNISFVSRLL